MEPINPIAALAGGIIGIAIGSLIGAIILRIAVKIAAKDEVEYSEAYTTAFIAAGLSFLVDYLLGLGAGEEAKSIGMQAISSFIGFAITVGVISWRLGYSIGRSFLIALTHIGIVVAIVLVIFVILLATGVLGNG